MNSLLHFFSIGKILISNADATSSENTGIKVLSILFKGGMTFTDQTVLNLIFKDPRCRPDVGSLVCKKGKWNENIPKCEIGKALYYI